VGKQDEVDLKNSKFQVEQTQIHVNIAFGA
jgi:hypothetical protein